MKPDEIVLDIEYFDKKNGIDIKKKFHSIYDTVMESKEIILDYKDVFNPDRFKVYLSTEDDGYIDISADIKKLVSLILSSGAKSALWGILSSN